MDAERPRPSRLAISFVVVGLALSAIGIAYIMSPIERELPPLDAPEVQARAQQLDALFRMLANSFLLFLVFLLGSYLMIRIGRRVLYQGPAGNRSEYVDAWSQYRLSQEEIDTATDVLDNDFPPDVLPDQENP
jgi:hypothetical protein